MPLTLMIALFATMIGTAFLSGIFGMAGGMILIGVLFWLYFPFRRPWRYMR